MHGGALTEFQIAAEGGEVAGEEDRAGAEGFAFEGREEGVGMGAGFIGSSVFQGIAPGLFDVGGKIQDGVALGFAAKLPPLRTPPGEGGAEVAGFVGIAGAEKFAERFVEELVAAGLAGSVADTEDFRAGGQEGGFQGAGIGIQHAGGKRGAEEVAGLGEKQQQAVCSG